MDDQNPASNQDRQARTQSERAASEQSGSASCERCELIKKELSQMTETCKRAMADLDNYKRGMAQQLQTEKIKLTGQILHDFLPLLDSFERSKKFMEQLPEEHKKGIEAIEQQLKKIFDKYGVQEIPTKGEHFNGTLHEAMMQGPGEAGVILDEFEKGYIIKDVVLRPAKVKVGDGNQG